MMVRRVRSRAGRASRAPQTRVLVFLPLGAGAIEAPGLLAGGQAVLMIEHLALAAIATLVLAVSYRIAAWILDA